MISVMHVHHVGYPAACLLPSARVVWPFVSVSWCMTSLNSRTFQQSKGDRAL